MQFEQSQPKIDQLQSNDVRGMFVQDFLSSQSMSSPRDYGSHNANATSALPNLELFDSNSRNTDGQNSKSEPCDPRRPEKNRENTPPSVRVGPRTGQVEPTLGKPEPTDQSPTVKNPETGVRDPRESTPPPTQNQDRTVGDVSGLTPNIIPGDHPKAGTKERPRIRY